MPSVVASVNGPNELVAQSATHPPAVVASTTSPFPNGAAQTDSVTGTLSDTLSAQSTTNPPSATPATLTPSAKDPAQDRPTPESASTTSPTSSTNSAINDAAPSTDASTQIKISTTQLADGPATSPAPGSANQSSGSSFTDSLLISPPGVTSLSTSPSSSLTTPAPGPSSSGTDSQAPTGAILISAASSPTTTSSASTSSGGTTSFGSTSASSGGTSFLQNKGAIIGVATAGSLLLVIFLIYVLTRVQRARRRRQFDREMDESFQEAMDKAAAGWRRSPSPDYSANAAALERAPSALSMHSAASFGAYAQPPLAVPQQQYNYGGFVAHPEYASAEYWAAAQAGPIAMAGHGTGMSAWMGQPQQHATPTYVQPGTGWAGPGFVREPPQSAAIQVHPESQAPPRDYLSNYTTSLPPADPGYGSPVEPASMLNPFDSKEERALKVANE